MKTARGAHPMIQHKVIMDKVNIKTFKVSAWKKSYSRNNLIIEHWNQNESE